MLEPEGLSPRETLLPRKGEGLGVGLRGKEGSWGWAPCWGPCAHQL